MFGGTEISYRCELRCCFLVQLMMGIPGAAVHKILPPVQRSLLQQSVLLTTDAARRCLNTNPYTVGTEGKLTVEWSCANNMTHLERTAASVDCWHKFTVT